MKKSIAILFACCLSALTTMSLTAQDANKTVLLPAGTSVIFELFASKPENIAKGTIIQLKVLMPVVANGEKLVTRESYAYAVVTDYHKQGVFGRSEMIEITPKGMQARDGQMIPIQGEPMVFKGEGRGLLAIGLSTLIPAAGFATNAKETRVLGAFAMTGLLIKGDAVNNLGQEPVQLVGRVGMNFEIGNTLLNAKGLIQTPNPIGAHLSSKQ